MVFARGVLVLVGVMLVASPVSAQVDIAGLWRPLARNQDGSGMDGDLAGLPPLYIQAGDWDTLVDDSHRLAAEARRAGVDVRLDVFPEMLHAFQIWAGTMPEADDAVARIGEYLRRQRAMAERPAGDPAPPTSP